MNYVKFLISFGADVNSALVHQQTPLFIACENSHPACVAVLMTHGANVDAGAMSRHLSALMEAAIKYRIPDGLSLDQFIDNRIRCMRLLLAAGATIDQIDDDGYTALMFATWNFRLTKILMEAGANVNILSVNNISAIHIASGRNLVNVVELMLERGSEIDVVTVLGRTPLHLACYHINPPVVELFLLHNADIDIADNGGRTSLHECARPSTSPNRVAVLQLMATCAQTRLEASSADWIRLARYEQH